MLCLSLLSVVALAALLSLVSTTPASNFSDTVSPPLNAWASLTAEIQRVSDQARGLLDFMRLCTDVAFDDAGRCTLIILQHYFV